MEKICYYSIKPISSECECKFNKDCVIGLIEIVPNRYEEIRADLHFELNTKHGVFTVSDINTVPYAMPYDRMIIPRCLKFDAGDSIKFISAAGVFEIRLYLMSETTNEV